MYRRILVPLDGSKLGERVLPYVRLLAEADPTPIVLLRVFEPVPPDLVGLSPGVSLAEITAGVATEAQEYLDTVAISLKEDGLDVASLVKEGNPASCIADEGNRESGTLIAMSTHGYSGITRWVMGSVTDKVLHATTNPLLIVRARDPAATPPEVRLESVIVPLDGSALAEEALPHTVYLANALGLKVTPVRVTPTVDAYYRYAEYASADWDNAATLVDDQAAGYLDVIRQKLLRQGVSSVEERLLHGPPATAIADLARETKNNLVVMTTHGRSGLGRWVLGSVADRVVRNSGDPVLVVRGAEPGGG
jgi:nucleotide-binding universal stress UspA family protein